MDNKPNENNVPKLLVSKRSASEALGVSVRTIENFIASKELPARKLGRRTLIPFDALRRFAARDHRTQGKINTGTAEEPLEATGQHKSTTDHQGEG
jgi:excisionase family DNA binding protein